MAVGTAINTNPTINSDVEAISLPASHPPGDPLVQRIEGDGQDDCPDHQDHERREHLIADDRQDQNESGADQDFEEVGRHARFEIVIEENCGNPELLTLQRLWFEPAPCSASTNDEILAAAPLRWISGPDASVAADPQREQNTEYAGTGA